MRSTPSAYLGVTGIVGFPVGSFVTSAFSQESYCWRNPDNDSVNRFTDVPCIGYDFPEWQGVLGTCGMFLVVASVVALILAAVLCVREMAQGCP
ncbi:hypothetical protein ACIQ1S_03065 [Streptomyces griseus]|uniref:hypothetical protein n=1 Tax=Streptomyces griseus TaxID=1911 RepID=UPI0037F8F8E1